VKRWPAPLVLMLAGCQAPPESFAPPEQSQPLEDFRPYRATRMVHMADGDAEAFFVRDIGVLEGGDWRWCGKRPTIRLRPRAFDRLYYVAELTLPEVTFRETGPVTLSFYVGDRLLDTVRFTEPGRKLVEKAVPVGWIVQGEETLVSAEIDKLWTSKDDGVQLGFILHRMGLEQR
jgi:hypothetical protein